MRGWGVTVVGEVRRTARAVAQLGDCVNGSTPAQARTIHGRRHILTKAPRGASQSGLRKRRWPEVARQAVSCVRPRWRSVHDIRYPWENTEVVCGHQRWTGRLQTPGQPLAGPRAQGGQLRGGSPAGSAGDTGSPGR